MRKFTLPAIVCVLLLLTGCLGAPSATQSGGFDTSIFSSATNSQSSSQSNSSTTTETEESDANAIQPSGSVEITALEYPSTVSLTTADSGAIYDGSTDVSITASGTYTCSGNFNGTTITVNVDKDSDDGVVYLVLDGVTMTSEDSTPLYIIEAQDVVIVLADGSVNTITQGAVETDDADFPSGAVYTKADTVITGSGTLSITTLYNDGINARDDLIIDGATITIDAVGDGITTKDFLAIANASITITAGADGIKTSNDTDEGKGNCIITSGSIYVMAQQDGISVAQTLQIDDGTFEIYAGGGYVEVLNSITVGEGSGNTVMVTDTLETSMKGIKAMDFLLNGGDFTISAYEDGMNLDNSMVINGGTLSILSGDDGITAEMGLTIYGGSVTVEYAYEGLEAAYLSVHGGDISVSVLDDAINGNGDTGLIYITDGNFYIASQGDGIDANNDLTIEGGYFVFNVNAIYNGGDSELDVSGTSTITGGTFVDVDGNAVSTSGSTSMGGFSSGFSSGFSNTPGNNQSNQRR